MNLSKYKRRTLKDIYFFYPYKKNLPFVEGVIPVPFVKHADCTDTNLSADWYEWQTIVLAYLEKLKLHLEEGNSIELGSRCGEFALAKLKTKSFIN